MRSSSKKKGIINTIVLIVVALIILGYLKIDIRDIFDTPLVQDNLKYAWDIFMSGFWTAWDFVVMIWEKVIGLVQSSRS